MSDGGRYYQGKNEAGEMECAMEGDCYCYFDRVVKEGLIG